MKTPILIPIFTLFFATQSMAGVNFRKLDSTIAIINELEVRGQYQSAALTAASTANSVAQEIGIDKTVAQVTTTLNEIRQETIVETKKQAAGFSFLLGLISGSASSSYDVTKMITVNPEEVEGFTTKTANDFRRLQGQLKTYVKDNESALFYAKVLAAKALQLTEKMDIDQLIAVRGTIMKSVQFIKQVQFAGTQTVNRCLTMNYVDRENSLGIAISGLFLSLNYSQSDVQHAHNEKSCSTSANSGITSESQWTSPKLMSADLKISMFEKAMDLRLVGERHAPSYPTWGSPYMK